MIPATVLVRESAVAAFAYGRQTAIDYFFALGKMDLTPFLCGISAF